MANERPASANGTVRLVLMLTRPRSQVRSRTGSAMPSLGTTSKWVFQKSDAPCRTRLGDATLRRAGNGERVLTVDPGREVVLRGRDDQYLVWVVAACSSGFRTSM